MTKPLPSPARAPPSQHAQSAAAPQKADAAALSTPLGLLPIGPALAAIIAGLPVPINLERQ